MYKRITEAESIENALKLIEERKLKLQLDNERARKKLWRAKYTEDNYDVQHPPCYGA